MAESAFEHPPLTGQTIQDIQKSLQHFWIHCNSGVTIIEYMRFYTRAPTTDEFGWSSQVYVVIIDFATSTMRYTQNALSKMPDNTHFLQTCATINQDFKKRQNYIHQVFRFLNRHWIKRQIDEGKKNVFEVADLFRRDWQATALPYLRERMDRIAWRVRAGCHNEWEVDGIEWRMIKSFYGSLELHVTLTALGFRQIFLCIRPVEFSMAQLEKLDQSGQSVERILQRMVARPARVNTKACSGTDRGKQVGKALIPAAMQHWSLVVSSDRGSTMWELVASGGNITVPKGEALHGDPPEGVLVGYTSLTNDEISTNAEAVAIHIGKDYNLANRNCQLLFELLHESIRTPLTFTDLFSGLNNLPISIATETTRRRCRELATTYLTPFTQPPSTTVTRLPVRLGTFYLGALAVITVVMVAYTSMVVGVWLSVMLSSYAMLWALYAKGYYAVYLRMATRLSKQDGCRFLYKAVYERVDDNHVMELITQSALPTEIVQQDIARVVHVDEDENET